MIARRHFPSRGTLGDLSLLHGSAFVLYHLTLSLFAFSSPFSRWVLENNIPIWVQSLFVVGLAEWCALYGVVLLHLWYIRRKQTDVGFVLLVGAVALLFAHQERYPIFTTVLHHLGQFDDRGTLMVANMPTWEDMYPDRRADVDGLAQLRD